MDSKPIDLYEFLVESELQQYYNSIKNELKISLVTHLKYANDEDLKQIGLSRPEIRRLRKFYEKYYPHGYFSKIKRLLQNPNKRDDAIPETASTSTDSVKVIASPSQQPKNKHIIPADTISVNKQLGTGEFGIVQQGVWTNGTDRIQVAIKCLCRERMQSNPMEFLKEASIMHSIEHENIVRLYGVVLNTDSLMLVTELAHLRSLLECLKDSGLRISFLTVPTLCEFAAQICSGMMYLENKRLIHRDLAARNILVFSKNKVKISDFGLSRALGVGKDYYQTNFNVNLKLPIAWCAPECINFLRFTNSSDVWAYGVCLWEMFSYGFQPWAALTGHQILEAIDEPNYQRLEPPECCPKEYYTLMLKCWQHDPAKRPKFSDIHTMLPDMKPEQLKTIVAVTDGKKDQLIYRQNEIITVLDKTAQSTYWKGVLTSGKTGTFNPANTVTYLPSLPSSTNRDTFNRSSDRFSKRKLRTEMISMPKGDCKHTGHIGLDGAFFGDVEFLSNAQNTNNVPRQIVTPYKPSEDIEQTPLLPQTPTSPDSLQTASAYFAADNIIASTNHSFMDPQMENVPNTGQRMPESFSTGFQPVNLLNPFINHEQSGQIAQGQSTGVFINDNLQGDNFSENFPWQSDGTTDEQHEYHEISDDEKLDIGSFADEMDLIFRSMASNIDQKSCKSPDLETTNKKNELTEMASKMQMRNGLSNASGQSHALGGGTLTGKSKKKAGVVKPISVKDERILNQAIDFTNEISTRSMTDLVSDNQQSTAVAQSPKRKFSFRFPNLSHQSNSDKDHQVGCGSNTNTLTRTRNFSEEIKNVPDLQNSISEDGREAYNCLVQKSTIPFETFEFDKSAIVSTSSTMTLPRKQPRTSHLTNKMVTSANGLNFNTVKHTKRTTMNGLTSVDVDSNPLRRLRDKNFPIVVPKLRVPLHTENVLLTDDKETICESPSYLTNAEYNFNVTHTTDPSTRQSNPNPIPLPFRDRTKTMPINVKRHVRKHPLIIPTSSFQRTLNKVTDPTPPEINRHPRDIKRNHLKQMDINRNVSDRLYENLQTLHQQLNESVTIDTASLNFESILESDDHRGGVLHSPDVVDGFAPFEIHKDHYDKRPCRFDDDSVNVNIEDQTKHRSSYKNEDNELATHNLFNKCMLEACKTPEPAPTVSDRSDTDRELETKLKVSSNFASCEDLLEFSDHKPKGRERGVESDEVRIMAKVLGTSVSPDQCIIILDHIDWDVHKAIKIIRLQNSTSALNLTYKECIDALAAKEWDVEATALQLNLP